MCCRLRAEWHKDNKPADQVAQGAGTKFLWICSACNHEYSARPNDRSKRNTGCPECSKRNRAAGKASPRHGLLLKDERPDLADEYDTTANSKPLDTLTCGSNFKADWICKQCSSSFQRTVLERAQRSLGCPVCAAKNRKGNRPQEGAVDDGNSETAKDMRNRDRRTHHQLEESQYRFDDMW